MEASENSKAPAAVEIKSLTKRFGRRIAVNQVSFEVRTGEILGLLGHNGAGKSSIIGCMLGQVFPTSGGISIFGNDVTTDRAQALARVGAIFETPCFYEYLSGWHNLKIFTGFSGCVDDEAMRETIELVEIDHRIHDLVGVYSHGMRQRLALAQALLPRPQLLILDEPADGLDPEGIHEMRELIMKLNREMGMTILLCSHQLHEVEQVCDRVAVLKEGNLLFCGDWREQNEGEHYLELECSNRTRVVSRCLEEGWLLERGEALLLADSDKSSLILSYLAKQEIDVKRFEIRRPELEEVYLGLSEQKGGAV
ncbi:MAG: ABC transporter ATP-binding protein [Verrucomicrobiota bacterium]